MDDMNERLHRLGDAVSDTAERLGDPSDLEAARKLWLSAPAPPPRSARGPVIFAMAAAAGAALLLGVVLRQPPVSFQVGAPPSRGAVGEWVAAEGVTPVPLRFSEGTSLTLGPGTRARVTETTTRGATIVLERGEVTAAVVHTGAETRWDLQAGPFEVHVTGTKFDASWDPAGETFTLVMTEGAVVVRGPLLQTGRELHAGERLRVSVHDGSMELRAASAAPPPGAGAQATASAAMPAPSASAVAPAAPSSALPATTSAPTASASARPREPGWRELAAAGNYREALAAAEQAGFSQEIERAAASDLAALADAARYGGRPALAKQALVAQRRRFGMRGSSAFVLGKIAADQLGDGGDAVRWFETYLSEEPNGALAEQALGRILELRKHDRAGARAVAERYLARYPSGAHAALARSLLSP
ncbi:hypothetical protein A7982_12905 [Minicystis rosea]|nr:hypothetical protein A7982_12905 [Minicystis rosea]